MGDASHRDRDGRSGEKASPRWLNVPLFPAILEAVIRFGETKFSIREPKDPGQSAVVRVPVIRQGDTSKVSVVRVHTKDGSATSGEDYLPVSEGTGAPRPVSTEGGGARIIDSAGAPEEEEKYQLK